MTEREASGAAGRGPFFEEALDALLVLADDDGRVLDANRRAGELLGASTEELRGRSLEQLLGLREPAERQRLLAELRRAAEGGRSQSEWRLEPAGREPLALELHLKLLPGGGELMAALRDVSELQRARQPLGAYEESFLAGFEHAAVAILHRDLEGRTLRANRRYFEMMHASPSQAHLLAARTPVGAEYRDEVERLTGRLLRGELPFFRFECPVERLDGSPFWASFTISLVRGTQGEPRYFTAVIEDVSERREAEARLRESEARYRDLFSQMVAPCSIYEVVLDEFGRAVDLRILAVNAAFERMSGVSGDVLVGRTLRGRSPRTEQAWIDRLTRTAQTGESQHFEQYSAVVGRWLEVSTFRPSPGKVAATFLDVTERRTAEKAREEHQREIDAQRGLLRAVIDHAPAFIGVLSGPELSIEMANRNLCTLLFGACEPGTRLVEAAPASAPRLRPLLEEVLRTGTARTAVDLPVQLPPGNGADARTAHLTLSAVPLEGLSVKPGSVLLVGLETSERVEARARIERMAAEAQRRAGELQTVIDTLAEGLLVCDSAGRVTLANAFGARLLGATVDELVGASIDQLARRFDVRRAGPEARAPERLAMRLALGGQTMVQHDEAINHLRTGREVRLRSSAAPLRDTCGVVVGAVLAFHDVTRLVEMERLKEEFILVAAHELKTPVAIMKGYAQLLLKLPPGASAPAHVLQAIDRGSDRIDRLVRDLLDVSQLSLGAVRLSVERVDLAELVSEVVARFIVSGDRHEVRLGRLEAATVQGDRERLSQVLLRLLDNAARYSPEGGETVVELVRQGDEAVVSVSDQGVGIPEEKQSRIFERFYRAHTQTRYDFGGMGVGLYIARELVRQHGGRMWFESRSAAGSTFHFSLPLPDVTAASAHRAAPANGC